MNNPTRKQTFAEKAIKHTELMEQQYCEEIEHCAETATTYKSDFSYNPTGSTRSALKVIDATTSEAAKEYALRGKGKVAVLDFASYKNPGGGFINGSIAQEESLCHDSFLYNVLQRLPLYYRWNSSRLNYGLYTNRGLYLRDVIFPLEPSFHVDVIVVAAPNVGAAMNYHHIAEQTAFDALESRIDFVLGIAANNSVNTLILGAFGCGVFRNNPYHVASVFKELLSSKYHCFDRVVFAVPKGKRDKNYEVFKQVILGED